MTPMDLLSGAGYILDSPGAWLRAAIGNVGDTIYGQDRTGWRASGREMLESLGVLGKNQDGIDTGDVAGFLAEMVLDPLNLVPFGAMYKGGSKLAKMATKAGPRWQHAVPPIDRLGEMSDSLGIGKDVISSFIPPGSRHIGEGAEAFVIGTPNERALRFATDFEGLSDVQPRIAADPLLQPSHTVNLPYPSDISMPRGILENMPVVTPMDKALAVAAKNRVERLIAGEIPPARLDALRSRGPSSIDDYTIDYWINNANVLQAKDEMARFMKGAGDARVDMQTPLDWRNPFGDAGTQGQSSPLRLVDPSDIKASEPAVPSEYDNLVRPLMASTFESGDRITKLLHERAKRSGFGWSDDHYANSAIMGNHAKIIDPGFMANPNNIPLVQSSEYYRMPAIAGGLADRLGYTDMVRNQWEGLPSVDPTIRNALLAAPSAGAANAALRQFLPQQY